MKVGNLLREVVLAAHPVGSYYWSSESTNPAELFGGTWEQVKDRFVLAAGDTYSAGAVGGEAKHGLTVNELPVHQPLMYLATTTTQSVRHNTLRYDWSNNWTTGAAGVDVGGGQAISIMPPYVVAYCWRRTA